MQPASFIHYNPLRDIQNSNLNQQIHTKLKLSKSTFVQSVSKVTETTSHSRLTGFT